MKRREFLKSVATVGTFTAIGLGMENILPDVLADEMIANPTPYDHEAIPVEMKIDPKTGNLTLNPDIILKNSVCLGCWSNCGNRVKVNKKTGKILRVLGNPYHPSNAEPHLPYTTSLKESYLSLGQYQELGHTQRATVCQRGNAAYQMVYDPNRILTPLKRTGQRGEGKWKPITWEQAIQETVEGGELFKEIGENGIIEGFRQIHDQNTPLNPEQPGWGPKANQLVFIGGRDDGRTEFPKRFITQCFGTPNFFGHGGICGASRRIAFLAFLDTWDKKPHMKADYMSSEFVMFFGNAPGQAGIPFQPMARKSALAQSERGMRAVIVDPVLQNGMYTSPDAEESSWVPVRPGADGALAMAMIRWAFEKKKINEVYLSIPSKEAATKKKNPSWTNATYLVIQEPNHPDFGKFLRAEQIGLKMPENNQPAANTQPNINYVAIDKATGNPENYAESDEGVLLYSGKLTIGGQEVLVKSSLQLLLEEANRFTFEQYAEACGLSKERIFKLAKEFFSHGTKAATDHHGGVSMHTNGFYSSMAVIMLNALVGNINRKGGSTKSGGGYLAVDKGKRYDLLTVPGMVKAKGFKISREGANYEDTPEFKARKAKGENPYPATLPWTPLSDALEGHVIPSMMAGYPYSAKILMLWMTNPLYATPGLFRKEVEDYIKDPKNVPLIIGVDVMMGDSSQYSDYIIPDTTFYESWGVPPVWNLILTKVTGARRPVIDPLVPKTKSGQPYSLESYLIEVGKRLNLPGVGDKAIPNAQGEATPMNSAADFFLKAMANIAFDETPVPDIEVDELKLADLEEDLKPYQSSLTLEEWKKVYYLLARGGRFEDYDKNYDGEVLHNKFAKVVNIYNETLGTIRNSMTGELLPGTATWQAPAFADGRTINQVYPDTDWPFQVISYKPRYRTGGYLSNVPVLKDMQDTNFIELNLEDATKLGIQSGDKVKLVTPSGEAEGTVKVRRGVRQGSIAVEYGYGHWGAGAKSYTVDGKVISADPKGGKGVLLNLLALRDISMKTAHPLVDLIGGSTDRNTIKARIIKL
ncbi:molybdopterin dinucleotide binding domain-containing protein [Desulfitobacterium sp.]|uniref:molybdopterin dinucleotide binding domain-containing protein n=1 Tax=Desulfitobacterium sp. TaxID=49981 RepID=UPI002BECF201|nr:molybdopterin dinucleotide binding domain-containing protein [Desulfitobacterium sp.]HVJ48182.1 molybdopterin dinucleotide binding domain-containing protein [Desulfitobacterium sp.]